MNCEDIANLLDSREILELTPAQHAEVTEHLHDCESCDSEWSIPPVPLLWKKMRKSSIMP